MIKRFLKYILATVIVSTAIILIFSRKQLEERFPHRDYAEIKKSGVLKAVTEYNALSFYVNKDTISGFDYELLNMFAKEKGLKLEITPEMSFEKRLKGISEGKYDMIAMGMATTTSLKDSLLFTRPLALGKQILIQRKNDSIKNALDMAGKTIYIVKNSPAKSRLENLMNEIADTIHIKEISEYGTEQLMAMVEAGDIDYAICDENTTMAYIKNFPKLDTDINVSFNQFYSWGVNKNATALLDSLNIWLDKFKQTKEYTILYNKYFNVK